MTADDFGLRFGDLEALVRGLRSVSASEAGIRLKYFQRRGFPEGVNPGAGGKVLYGLEQVLQLVVAMELTALGLPPGAAGGVVQATWPSARAAVVEAWWSRSVAEGMPDRPLLILSGDPEERSVGERANIRLDRFQAKLTQGVNVRRCILLDVVQLMSAMAEVLPGISGATIEEIDAAFDALPVS